jgi:chemotaxis response regulator CheB
VRRPQRTLDSYCANQRLRPDVLKIDVEGAEVSVLTGARDILSRARPVVFLSVHPRHMVELGTGVHELQALIAEAGYVAQEPGGAVPQKLRFGEYVLRPSERAA